MPKSILFVFSDYPPKTGPGSNRNFYLKQHFSQLGWTAKVLTMEEVDSHSDQSFIDDSDIIRAYSKDATQVLSIAGKYPKIVEIPDRWYLWILPALFKGYKQSKKSSFDFVYAGFPSYSSVIVGTILSKILKKPLILDLRDPFRFRYDPDNMPAHWLYNYLENKSINQSKYLLTTTQDSADYYQALYPKFPKSNIHVIQNGYAQEFHQTLESKNVELKSVYNTAKPFILLHSGILYQIGRNPKTLLKAIHKLIKQDIIKVGEFILRFRGATPWPALTELINKLELTDYIEFKERVSYLRAIEEMRTIDANVLIQNSLFNLQIPSKLYDILALKNPILAVTDEQGALAKEMKYLDLPYFSSCIDQTATLITKLIEETQPPLSDKVLQYRNRFTMNQHLSHILSSSLNSNEKK